MPFSLPINPPTGGSWPDAKWYIHRVVNNNLTDTGEVILSIYKDAGMQGSGKTFYEVHLPLGPTPATDGNGVTIRGQWSSVAFETRPTIETYLKTLKVYFQNQICDLTLAT